MMHFITMINFLTCDAKAIIKPLLARNSKKDRKRNRKK